uniref:Uncharacterized protein n=1 Tax=Triticum urartu TaxID=4572 RepID=A0A8R7THS9_TRIUA
MRRGANLQILDTDPLMEGGSVTSPLGVPMVAMTTACAPALSAVESINIVRNQDYNNATLFAEINSPMLLIDDFSTPKKKESFSQELGRLN